MELHRVVEGTGPRIVLVHGFTQTGVSWRHGASALADTNEVVRVDLPGHGGSGGLRANLFEGAAALADAGGRATYVGYSLGGRFVLRLALDRPDLVEGMVLIGATAGIDDSDERRARRLSDEALARTIENDGVEAFVTRWLSQPLFAGLPDDADERRARLANTAEGLASSLRLAGTATLDPPWWGELAAVTAPTVAMAGGDDVKFSALARRLTSTIGSNARTVIVPGAGHAAHLVDLSAVLDEIRALAEP